MSLQSYSYAAPGLTQIPLGGGPTSEWLIEAHRRADQRIDRPDESGCIFGVWYRRSVERRKMQAMSDAVLTDIGATREAWLKEVHKPFWRA